MLDISCKHKFRFLRNLQTFTAKKEFQTKYCERLKEVTRTLDLDVEDLPEKSEVLFDENGFSSTFYDGFIPEFCGTSIESISNNSDVPLHCEDEADLLPVLNLDNDLELSLTQSIAEVAGLSAETVLEDHVDR